MSLPRQSRRFRAAAIACAVVAAAVVLAQPTRHPRVLVESFAWTELLVAIVVGACLTGWRVAQFPKSRAIEFHLATPLSDWEHVGGQIVGGMLRTLLITVASAPLVAAMWGAGWIGPAEALALVAIPLAAGWTAGILLAVVSYEPYWLRRLLERLVLAGILAYLILIGLLGNYFVPHLIRFWSAWFGTPAATFGDVGAMIRYFNPFRLLQSVGSSGNAEFAWRVAAVFGLLCGVSALGLWRLAARLRPHYYEENYGRPFDKREYRRPVGRNPLAWWTARRVSRFKGNVNLYLLWATIGLYSAWLLLADRWPAWLAVHPLLMIEEIGGASVLALVAVQLSVVPVAFLNGLWDRNEQERVRRLELLLASPLAGRQFLEASAVAGWTRGRGYTLAALVMWMATAFAGRMSWPVCLGLALLVANYLLLSFAVAFRNFARTESDHAVTVRGLVWSVGSAVLTVALLQIGAGRLAAVTPLGGMYLVSLPISEQAQLTGLAPPALWGLVAIANLVYLGCAVALLRAALVHFDQEIRDWFATHLVSRQAADAEKTKGAAANRPLPGVLSQQAARS